jgi:ketosteroid isomerase-like protein
MKTARLLLMAICSAALSAAAQSGIDAGAVTTVLALEHAWNQAEQRNDAKALDAILDNALLYIDYDGSLRTKAEFLARVKSTAGHLEVETTESMKGQVFGSTVVVTGVYTAKGVEKGKAYVHRGRFVDTWVFRDGKWLCAAAQATPIMR